MMLINKYSAHFSGICFSFSKLTVISLASALLLAAPPLLAKNKDPIVTEVYVDLDANEMHIIGEEFDEPKVRLGNYPSNLNLISGNDDLLVVELPAGLVEGSYVLEVENKKNKSTNFDLTIASTGGGGSGEQGPAGPQGEAGPAGVQGPAGAQGPVGPQGSAGAQGPAGPQGSAGAQGSAGPQGAQGAAGAQGPAGDKGDQGEQGISGIIAAVSANDFVTAPAQELAFISAVVNVNIQGEGHSAFINLSAALGTTLNNVLPLNIYPCYQREDEEGGSSGLITLGGGMWDLSVPQSTRTTMSLSAVLSEAPPGNYEFGMCGEVPDQGEDEGGDPIDTQWDNNDFSYVSVLVFE